MRMREYSETIPKPMVPIGYRPILWHVMKYYAHFGHVEFILCLGWKGDAIKEYFLNYNECLSNDFVLQKGGNSIKLLNRDIDDWKITFVDTNVAASIGQRLRAVREHLGDDEIFLANYSDGLTDLHLPDIIERFQADNAIGTFLSVRPAQTFHAVATDDDGFVLDIQSVSTANIWINGGYFVFHRDIFQVLGEGEELIEEPFRRLINERRLTAYKYDGFWGCMDTFKEKQDLDEKFARGDAPWEVWKNPPRSMPPRSLPLTAIHPR
jgi:glucose-1-phosphate cytidylyltransferase